VIPGKTYTPEDFLDIARRRKWLIIAPFVIVATITAIQSRLIPNMYRSETVILVVPQRIPDIYVRATVTSRIEDRLQSIAQQILSRTFLEHIIVDFDLYAEARKTGVMENIVERMRQNDIKVEPVKGDAFKITYVSGDPQKAMQVTDRLASLFIEANRHDREVLADGTNQFLESQLEDARRRLAEHEKKVEEYRQRYSGELPTQVESNLQVIQNTQLQVQALVESIDRDRDRRLILQRSMADLSTPEAVVETAVAAAAGSAAAEPTGLDDLGEARRTLKGLEARLTAAHPDVIRAKRLVRELEAKAAAEAALTPATQTSAAPTAPVTRASVAEAARLSKLRNLQSEMTNLDRQIAQKEGEERRLRGVMSSYQARVEAAPARESELIELTRDYTTLQSVYTNLLTKREDSKVAANLERRQAGEQFRILDPARVPEQPFSPNRTRMNLMGALAGLGLGLGLAALLEYRDTSLRTDDDVVSSIGLPVLAMIPMMATSADERRRLRNRWIMEATAAVAMMSCTAAILWKVAAH
jgi:polysaccharide chain length determinant protein (PEP-CTERM system associated)